jgi:hypothetical protein
LEWDSGVADCQGLLLTKSSTDGLIRESSSVAEAMSAPYVKSELPERWHCDRSRSTVDAGLSKFLEIALLCEFPDDPEGDQRPGTPRQARVDAEPA